MFRRQTHHILRQIFCAVGHWPTGTHRLDRGCGAPHALLAAFSPLRRALVTTTTCSFVVRRAYFHDDVRFSMCYSVLPCNAVLGVDDGRFAITSFTRPPARATHSSPQGMPAMHLRRTQPCRRCRCAALLHARSLLSLSNLSKGLGSKVR